MHRFAGSFWLRVGVLSLVAGLLLSGAVLTFLLPRAAERVVNEVETEPFIALLLGFALVVGLASPVAARPDSPASTDPWLESVDAL